jgi:hypothetical protein
MNVAARTSILRTLEGVSSGTVLTGFLGDDFPTVDDYLLALRESEQHDAADRIAAGLSRAMASAPIPMSGRERIEAEEHFAETLLLHMPEHDFRHAIAVAAPRGAAPRRCEERITSICKRRGIPWRFTMSGGFEWTGDEAVETLVMTPALSAVEDPRLAGATRSEFNEARERFAEGDPEALATAVHKAGCAVESAMKVVLTEHGVPYKPGDAAFSLFKLLVDAGVAPRSMEFCVLGAASPRNKMGGHGAGVEPHEVPPEMAEAVLASAAAAIAYLRTLLQ